MTLLDHFAARAAAANERNFSASGAVVLAIDHSQPEDIWRLDHATTFALASERQGRARRTIYAAEGRVVFEFEDGTDCRAFAARFGIQ